MQKICDLHTHSNCSDGSLSPEELAAAAKAAGLSAIALTDHNTVKGLAAFLKAGDLLGLETIAGCEFSTDYGRREQHIVGLFLPREAWDDIEAFVLPMRGSKHQSNLELIARLHDAGYDITYEDAAAYTEAEEINRSHVARALLAKGYVRSVRDAFERLLDRNAGFYQPPARLDAFETIRFIKRIGGTAVLAHPLRKLDVDALRVFLPQAKENGLDAMETHYGDYTAEETQCMTDLAAEFDLLSSGGSDFHGASKPHIALGRGTGRMLVPYAFCEALRARANR
ncbi:MAG TPA: hypothetical protein DDX71_01950 [Ruminococcus sp.]|nr:hypothetical protein [Ruminococcus sp.]